MEIAVSQGSAAAATLQVSDQPKEHLSYLHHLIYQVDGLGRADVPDVLVLWRFVDSTVRITSSESAWAFCQTCRSLKLDMTNNAGPSSEDAHRLVSRLSTLQLMSVV